MVLGVVAGLHYAKTEPVCIFSLYHLRPFLGGLWIFIWWMESRFIDVTGYSQVTEGSIYFPLGLPWLEGDSSAICKDNWYQLSAAPAGYNSFGLADWFSDKIPCCRLSYVPDCLHNAFDKHFKVRCINFLPMPVTNCFLHLTVYERCTFAPFWLLILPML